MTHETREKIRTLAGEALAHFEYRDRYGGSGYWAVKDRAPEWVGNLVWAAHEEGKILPDDFRYLFIVEALEALAEDPDEPEALLQPETYTSQLLKWLEASPSYREGLVGEAVALYGWDGLFEALRTGHLLEKEEVLQIVREFLEDTIEEEEEED